MSDDEEAIEAELAALRSEYWAALASEARRRKDVATRRLLELAREREEEWQQHDRWIASLPDSPAVWQARLEGFRLGLELARASGRHDSPTDCTPQCRWARLARQAREDAGG